MALWFACGGLLAICAENACRLNTVMSRFCFQISNLSECGVGVGEVKEEEPVGGGEERDWPTVYYSQVGGGYMVDHYQIVSSIAYF